MMRKWLSALLILIVIPPHVAAMDDYEGYLKALRKEINNRALAGVLYQHWREPIRRRARHVLASL